jgi:hypothetical protein
MTPHVLLVAAAVVTSTIAVVFAVWSLLAYFEFKKNREKSRLAIKRFAEIRAGAVSESGRSLPLEDLSEELLVELLFQIQYANLADVPKEWVNRIGRLAKRRTDET